MYIDEDLSGMDPHVVHSYCAKTGACYIIISDTLRVSFLIFLKMDEFSYRQICRQYGGCLVWDLVSIQLR